MACSKVSTERFAFLATKGSAAMNALDLARWQFGITTVYHFLFVPLTIGLSVLVAGPADRLVPHRRTSSTSGSPSSTASCS